MENEKEQAKVRLGQVRLSKMQKIINGKRERINLGKVRLG